MKEPPRYFRPIRKLYEALTVKNKEIVGLRPFTILNYNSKPKKIQLGVKVALQTSK